MATLILASVGATIGGGFGGAILGFSGAAIGGMIGSTIGAAVDTLGPGTGMTPSSSVLNVSFATFTQRTEAMSLAACTQVGAMAVSRTAGRRAPGPGAGSHCDQ